MTDEMYKLAVETHNNGETNAAMDLFFECVSLGCVKSMECLGSIYYDYCLYETDEDNSWCLYNSTVEWYQKAIDAGSVNALLYLGIIHTVESKFCDLNKAIDLFQRVISLDPTNIKAICYLGDIYLNGYDDIPQDVGKAIEIFQLGIDLNSAEITHDVAALFHAGNGVPKDIPRAIKLYQKAIDLGYSKSMFYLSKIYKNSKDYPRYIKLLEMASDLNLPSAMFDMALEYNDGVHVSRDNDKFVDLTLRSANLGNKHAKFNMATIYYTGIHLGKDVGKALDLYQEAAELGQTDAMYTLGVIYFYGVRGVVKDTARGYELLNKAASLDHDSSLFMLGYIYCNGENVNQDIPRGLEYVEKAVKMGCPQAMYYLGQIYYTGVIVKMNVEKSVKLLYNAAKLGLLAALFELGSIFCLRDYKSDIISKIVNLLVATTNISILSSVILGSMQLVGICGPVQSDKAFKLFKKHLINTDKDSELARSYLIHFITIRSKDICPEDLLKICAVYSYDLRILKVMQNVVSAKTLIDFYIKHEARFSSV